MRLVPLFLMCFALVLAASASAQDPPAQRRTGDAASDSIRVSAGGPAGEAAREAAVHALVAMEEVRDRVSPAHRNSPVFQEAALLEARGRQLNGAALYARATALFDAARERYLAAENTPTPAALPPPALQTAIEGYARALRTSLEEEDTDGMHAMRYVDRDWPAFFAGASATAATVSTGPAQLRGRSATVSATVSLAYRDAEARLRSETLRHLWLLQFRNDDWMLIDVVVQP